MSKEEIEKYTEACKAIITDCLKGNCPPETLNHVATIMNYADLLQNQLVAIRPLAFADHSSVEVNMEEIRKILNENSTSNEK